MLVLTSEQEEPFADDALDTMGFIASIVSRYLFSYRECIARRYASYQRNEVLVMRLLKSLQAPLTISTDGYAFRFSKQQPFLSCKGPDGTERPLGIDPLFNASRSPVAEEAIELLRTSRERATGAAVDQFLRHLANPASCSLPPGPPASPITRSLQANPAS